MCRRPEIAEVAAPGEHDVSARGDRLSECLAGVVTPRARVRDIGADALEERLRRDPDRMVAGIRVVRVAEEGAALARCDHGAHGILCLAPEPTQHGLGRWLRHRRPR